jgi:hypothetical protein
MRPIFDDEAFVEWIGRQKPERRYIYDSCEDCLIARYLKAKGFQSVWVNKYDVILNGEKRKLLPYDWNAVAEGRGKTYGQAHQRALGLLG